MTRGFRLFRDGVTALALLAFIWLIALKLQRGAEDVFTGTLDVVDGDTLISDGQRLRLFGLDAPELAQSCGESADAWACGQSARGELQRLMAAPAECRSSARDKYRRPLVSCRVGTFDPAAEMVLQGLAVSTGEYDREERQARKAELGIWAGHFVRPADWRRQHAAIDAGVDGLPYVSGLVEWLGFGSASE